MQAFITNTLYNEIVLLSLYHTNLQLLRVPEPGVGHI